MAFDMAGAGHSRLASMLTMHRPVGRALCPIRAGTQPVFLSWRGLSIVEVCRCCVSPPDSRRAGGLFGRLTPRDLEGSVLMRANDVGWEKVAR